MIQQETSEKQAEKHDQTADEVGNSTIPENNANEETDVGGGKIEKDQDQQEVEELGPRRNQPCHGVDNDAHDDRRDQPQRNDVKYNLGRKVCDRMIVTVGPLTHEQKPLRGEHIETGQSAEPKQGQDEEEEAKTILEALDVISEAIE